MTRPKERPLRLCSRRAVLGVGVGVVTSLSHTKSGPVIATVYVPPDWADHLAYKAQDWMLHAEDEGAGPFLFDASTWERLR